MPTFVLLAQHVYHAIAAAFGNGFHVGCHITRVHHHIPGSMEQPFARIRCMVYKFTS